jgi:hypothetical protein
MTIWDLETRATLGPVAVLPDDNMFGRFMQIPHSTRNHSEDATMLAHCRNNFFKALTALKHVAANAGDTRGRDGEFINEGLYKLITELETVI